MKNRMSAKIIIVITAAIRISITLLMIYYSLSLNFNNSYKRFLSQSQKNRHRVIKKQIRDNMIRNRGILFSLIFAGMKSTPFEAKGISPTYFYNYLLIKNNNI